VLVQTVTSSAGSRNYLPTTVQLGAGSLPTMHETELSDHAGDTPFSQLPSSPIVLPMRNPHNSSTGNLSVASALSHRFGTTVTSSLSPTAAAVSSPGEVYFNGGAPRSTADLRAGVTRSRFTKGEQANSSVSVKTPVAVDVDEQLPQLSAGIGLGLPMAKQVRAVFGCQ
jgi:hypothetical protein